MKNNTENTIIELHTSLLGQEAESLVDIIIDLENKQLSDHELIPLIRQKENKDVRCWAMLKIKEITNDEDAATIVEALHINDSRIRELASDIIFKHFNEDYDQSKNVFNNDKHYDLYVKTVTDINPRVTRNITAIYKLLYNKNLLFDKIMLALQNEKGTFLHYWSLEGIGQIIQEIDEEKLKSYCSYFINLFNGILLGQDNLLKEKVAFILIYYMKYIDLSSNQLLKKNIIKLKKDPNFYIKKIADNILLKED